MTNLKSVNIGFNKFCGPAVLSILTGKTTDECADVISKISGQYTITGVQLNTLLMAADRLGFDQINIGSHGTLYKQLVTIARNDGLYIITVPNHFVVIEVKDKQLYFCDNHTKEPIPASASARLMQQVVACHKVSKRENYVEPTVPKLIKRHITVNHYMEDNGIRFISIADNSIYDYPESNTTKELANLQLTEKEFAEMMLQLNEIK